MLYVHCLSCEPLLGFRIALLAQQVSELLQNNFITTNIFLL